MSHSKVSVIIVNFNCGLLLTDCVRSVLASTVSVEVFVSDNGSVDDSIQYLQQEISDERLQITLNKSNLGFAKASNMLLPKGNGDFLLFLNPDCLIKPDTVERMVRVLESQPDVGMAGCLLRNTDGSEQAGCRRRVPTPARTLVRVLYLDRPFPFLREKGTLLYKEALPDAPQTVEAISGAFMLVRREALEDVGLMDEAYFLHCEDLDWCMRFRRKGWKILFVPDVAITHHKGHCSHDRPIRVEWHKHKGMVRFYCKHFRHQYPAPLLWLVICAVWGRFFAIASFTSTRKLASRY